MPHMRLSTIWFVLIAVSLAGTYTNASGIFGTPLDTGMTGGAGFVAAVPVVTVLVPVLLTLTRSMRGSVACAALIVTLPLDTATDAPAQEILQLATASVMSGLPWAVTLQSV